MGRRKRSCRMPKPISGCLTSPRKPMRLRASGKASKTQRRVVCVRRVKHWKSSAATMPYLVRLADRALRDMEAIYEFIDAEAESAFAWFNDLAREIYSLERFPERGAVIRESKRLRHLLFGKKPSTYRIIYALDKRKHLVSVLHIRHSARAPLSGEEKRHL